MQPLFFGMSTWRMEAHVARHPGQALPLTAAQVAVVAATSALWSIVSGGERKMTQGRKAGEGRGGGRGENNKYNSKFNYSDQINNNPYSDNDIMGGG